MDLEVGPPGRGRARPAPARGRPPTRRAPRSGVAGGRRRRARDVAGVAARLRAGVEQQHAPAADAPLALVVERRALLVEGDDRRVGQLRLGAAHGADERLVDLELGGPGREGLARRAVAPGAERGRLLQAAHLVLVLVAAHPVEPRGERRRVRREPGRGRALRLVPDVGGVRRPAERLPGGLDRARLLEVEGPQPEGVGHAALLVPVVLRRVADEAGLLPGNEVQQVVRPAERAPVREVRHRLEGRVPVVGEVREGRAARDDERAEAGVGERLLRLGLEALDVLGEEGGEIHGRLSTRAKSERRSFEHRRQEGPSLSSVPAPGSRAFGNEQRQLPAEAAPCCEQAECLERVPVPACRWHAP